jgi:diaminopimelate decarboxylase
VIDLGGGFPWPFAVEGRGPDLVPLAAALRTLLESAKLGDGVEFWFESGRYIAASSGMLLTRVMEVKRSRATVFYLLDTGIAHLGGMSGIGRVLRPAASLLPLRMESSGNTMVADVVGPLCTPLDCLARSAKVPEVEAGEIVAIPNTGAYGATASLTNFLGRPTATEVSLRDGRVVNIARLRAGHEQLLRNQGEFCDD